MMKYSILGLLVVAFVLNGCAASKHELYYETTKSVSKDNTMSQTACWAAIGEIAKGSDSTVRVGAIALAEKCKNEVVKVEPPKTNWLGL
jgi:uncharacterized lipoprotein YajG